MARIYKHLSSEERGAIIDMKLSGPASGQLAELWDVQPARIASFQITWRFNARLFRIRLSDWDLTQRLPTQAFYIKRQVK